MATLANVFGKFFTRELAGAEATSPAFAAEPSTRVRAFANEDIYFYVKRIDNTAVIRQADPASNRASWRMVGMAAAAAVVLVAILMPKGYNVLAGYEIQSLKAENEKLLEEEKILTAKESRLMSPERMAEIAKMQKLIDPAPDHIVYLDADSDSELASIPQTDGTK
jgi:hypothetical protein